MINISYHGSSSDPFYNTDALGRCNYYGGLTFPVTRCDGGLSLYGSYDNVRQDSAAFASSYNQRRVIASPCSIVISGLYNSSTRAGRVKATVTNTGSTNLSNRRLRYVIVETVHHHWQWQDSCWEVCRKMLPDAMGVSLTLSPGQTKADSQSFTLGSGWNEAKVKFVVFVQYDSGAEILQGAWVPLSSFSGVEKGLPAEPAGKDVVLAQNRPNPVRGSTEISFSLPKAEQVCLAVYDAQGRLVKTLTEGTRSAGTHHLSVSGLKSGVYFYRLEAGNTSLTRRMVVSR